MPDGETAISSALNELELHGYLIRARIYTNGKISDTEYHFYEQSVDTELEFERLKTENLIPVNSVQLNPKKNNLTKQTKRVKSNTSDEVSTHSQTSNNFNPSPKNNADDILVKAKEHIETTGLNSTLEKA